MIVDKDANSDIQQRTRFPFGANWAEFLEGIEHHKIEEAKEALRQMLGVSDLKRSHIPRCRLR